MRPDEFKESLTQPIMRQARQTTPTQTTPPQTSPTQTSQAGQTSEQSVPSFDELVSE